MNIMKIEERITKKQLQQIYKCNRKTIKNWELNYNLPIIKVTDKSGFVRLSDLIAWENSMILSNKFIDILES